MNSQTLPHEAVQTARDYYNSEDADNFYFHIWGGEDIHIGLYNDDMEDIAVASRRTVATMAKSLSGLNETSKLLDIGSGYGGAARYLAKQYGCHVTALNLSETENKRNRDMSRTAGLGELITVIDGDFSHIPFEGNQYDYVWSQDAILHSPRRKQVLSEVARVLKPGGAFIFTDPMQADNLTEGVLIPVLERIHLDSLGSIEFYRQAAREAGLMETHIEMLTPHLITHYLRVHDELKAKRPVLDGKVSDGYIERMLKGLKHWVDAGKSGHLAWGIMHFTKPI